MPNTMGEGNGNPFQYSCLENPMDRGAWWAAVHGVAQSQTQLKRLSMHACVGEGNGNPLLYSCLENPRDRGAWWAVVYGLAQSRTRLKRPSSSISSSSQHNTVCVENLYVSWVWNKRTDMLYIQGNLLQTYKGMEAYLYFSEVFLLAAKSLQSCPTLCDPIDGSPPGSPVPGILEARTLEWVAISFSNAWK